MSTYTIDLAPEDLTHEHIGRLARYEAMTPDGYEVHEGKVRDISFGVEHLLTWGGEHKRDILTAEVRIDYEWYPLMHVRFAETDNPWGKRHA